MGQSPIYGGTKFLRNETSRALAAIEAGDVDGAVIITKHLVGACMVCHAQAPSIYRMPSSVGAVKISPFERAPQSLGSPQKEKFDQGNFYIATKQYDLAMDTFNQLLIDKSQPGLDADSWYEIMVRSIGVAVRAKKNPSLALEMISSIFDAKAVPESMKGNAKYWRQALKAWRTEISQGKDFLSGSDTAQLDKVAAYASAIDQRSKAQKLEPSGPSRFLIERLRISMVVNDLLQRGTLGKDQVAKAYYVVGRKFLVD